MTSCDMAPHNPVPCKQTMKIAISHCHLHHLPMYNTAAHAHTFPINQIVELREETTTFCLGWKKVLIAKYSTAS